MSKQPLPGPRWTRRRVIEAGALSALAVAGATGCSVLSTKPKPRGDSPSGSSGNVGSTGGVAAGKEAPALAQQVKAGSLPPVSKRLPENPLVVSPVDSPGVYGGTWRMGVTGGSGSYSQLNRFQGYEGLMRWKPDYSAAPIPNVAEKVRTSAAGATYTFTLRKGMRWSDGEPFTAEDVIFWWEDVVLNKDLTPDPPAWMVIDNKLGSVRKVGDYEVEFSFSKPHGLFLELLAEPGNAAPVRYAKHYLKKYHQKYNANVSELVKKERLSDWVQLFQNHGGTDDDTIRWTVVNQPSLFPWIFSKAPDGGTGKAIAQRNPYYWKVDEQGRQLPYLDKLQYSFLAGSDTNALTLMALGGQIDMEDQFFCIPQNKPVLADGREKGKFEFYTTTPAEPNQAVIQLNLNHKDPVKREILGNKNFRIGLSYALNRQEIIDLILLKQGTPWQAAPAKDSVYYNEQLATQYTEYSVDKANSYLDQAGYQKNSSGVRLGPDGKPISIAFDIDNGRPVFVDLMPMIKNYWQAVGVQVSFSAMERSLWEERVRTNADFDATVHRFGGGSGEEVELDPRYYFPLNGNSVFAARWQAWYNGLSGDSATAGVEKPPAAVQHQMKLYDQVKLTVQTEQRAGLMKEILQIAADEFYVIGISAVANGYGVVRNDFHNVPKSMPASYIYPNPGPCNPEQFYIAG